MKFKFLLSLLFVGLFTLQSYAQIIKTEKLDNYINYLEKKNKYIGNISIFQNGKEVYNRDFGQSHLKKVNYNEDTKYYVGSITKLFTATLIWKLIEQEKLNLDDKLAMFFPKMPNAKSITIKNLLEHSSGLSNYVIKQDTLYYWLRKPTTKENILNVIKNQGVLFQPGDSVVYSNSGYYLLARIAEKEYHNNYGDILKKHIVKPLNLQHTFSIEANPTNVYPSYHYVNGHWEKIDEFYFKNVVGVGDIASTPKDLNTFITALFNYKILSKETIQKMKPIKGKEYFGRGLMFMPFTKHYSYGHGGDTFGTHSYVFYNPKNGIAISYAINGVKEPEIDTDYYPTDYFALNIQKIIYGVKFKYPTFNFTNPNPKKLSKYLGTYVNPNIPFKLKVYEEKDILIVKIIDKKIQTIPLIILSKNKYKFVGGGGNLEFNPKNKSLILKIKQGDFEFNMEKG